ncbi:MAG: hypothetical protein IJ061_04675, partial [Lachnospiraceae bacterium]|nr:hypothetical protein [Lachnospiraceae bacterium]
AKIRILSKEKSDLLVSGLQNSPYITIKTLCRQERTLECIILHFYKYLHAGLFLCGVIIYNISAVIS